MRFAVDPEFDLFRRLDLAESPPALSELFGADDVLFVLPGAAPEGLHDAYRDLAERLGARRGARDDNPAQLPADRPVWLLGWGNQHRAIIAKALAEQSVDFYGDGVSIEGSRRSRGHECVVLTGRRSNAARSAIGWVGCDNRRAFAGLARKLPHYGKYGFLSFRGDAPSNVLKGQWRVTESPLIVRLDQAAGWAPLQPVRRARLLDAIEGP